MVAAALPAVDIFVSGLVDYAGLFPPAGLDMASAVHNYNVYRSELHARILGRFVVPVARLQEFFEAAAAFFPRRRGDEPWRLAALGGANVAQDIQTIAASHALPTRARDGGGGAHVGSPSQRAVVEALEIKVGTVAEIEALHAVVPEDVELNVEVPLSTDPTPFLTALQRVGASAKIRTGGVTAEAIPATADVARFLVAVAAVRIPFKATAGLHHAVRGRYPLTYAADSPEATMHGFVNVFAAAALVRAGGSVGEVTALLEETDASTFRFGPAGLRWRDHQITVAQLSDTREHFARSFGSCSFREPIQDLQAWGVL
jgi:hypothetical protein